MLKSKANQEHVLAGPTQTTRTIERSLESMPSRVSALVTTSPELSLSRSTNAHDPMSSRYEELSTWATLQAKRVGADALQVDGLH